MVVLLGRQGFVVGLWVMGVSTWGFGHVSWGSSARWRSTGWDDVSSLSVVRRKWVVRSMNDWYYQF